MNIRNIKQTPDCQCCGRRNFLKQFGLLVGAASIPGTISAAVPMTMGPYSDKKDSVKVRLVFSIWDDIQVRKTWPNVGYDFRGVMKQITDVLNSRVDGVEFIPGKAFDEVTVDAILKEDAVDGNIAGYLVLQMNTAPTAGKFIAEKSDKPLLYCSYPYSGVGGWVQTNSAIIRSGRKNFSFISSFIFDDIVGAAGAFSVLRSGTGDDFVKAVTDYRLLHTPEPGNYIRKEFPVECLTPDETLAGIKGMKILSVQNNNPSLFEKIRNDFGIEVEVLKFEEVEAYAEKADENKAAELARSWKNGADYVENVSDETLFGCAKMYYGMKDVLEEKGAVAITIDCLGGCYSGKIKSYPCLGFMQLQDEGLFGVCENDFRSTVTMMVFTAMTKGLMGYVSDPVIDSSHRAIVYAHCVSTRRFFGPESRECPYEILTHSEDRQGASVRVLAPAGYPVTSLLFDFNSRKMVIHSSIVTGNDYDDRACRTKIITEVVGDYEKIYTEWDTFGWHRVSFLGDFAKDAEALADRLGYKIIRES